MVENMDIMAGTPRTEPTCVQHLDWFLCVLSNKERKALSMAGASTQREMACAFNRAAITLEMGCGKIDALIP